MWSWLRESWAEPNPAAPPAPRAVADASTLLTTEAVTKMAAFWSSFMQQPDSIQSTGRLANQQQAGLTAEQEEVYRAAFISAKATADVGDLAGSINPTSVLAKNVEFISTHASEVSALDDAEMWNTP
jgi:hypothetical protein